jgi:hypothetical protein
MVTRAPAARSADAKAMIQVRYSPRAYNTRHSPPSPAHTPKRITDREARAGPGSVRALHRVGDGGEQDVVVVRRELPHREAEQALVADELALCGCGRASARAGGADREERGAPKDAASSYEMSSCVAGL